MDLTFLEAGIPLQKTFTNDEHGNIVTNNYPMVRNFTSHTFELADDDIEEFYNLIHDNADEGYCLLKGTLLQPLVNESRASKTNPHALTRWICFDFDGVNDTTLDNLLKALKLNSYSHIIQYSSKMGVLPSQGISAHVFFLLDEEVYPASLKNWLKNLNFTVPTLRSELRLTRDNNQLRWPLDISVCQNDKLIYISPPKTLGTVKDVFEGERIQLIKKRKNLVPVSLLKLLELSDNIAQLDETQRTVINELRSKANLGPKDFKTKVYRGETVDANPTAAQITGIKEDRGFTYLNINGGDSWGYFHPTTKPHIISNFKGETPFATKDLLPDYFDTAVERAKEAAREDKEAAESRSLEANKERYDQALEEADVRVDGYSVFVINDPATDTYRTLKYEHASKDLTINKTSSRHKLSDFMAEHGQEEPAFIPNWTLEFAFHADEQFSPKKQWINLYRSTSLLTQGHEYLKTLPEDPEMRAAVTACPPLCERVIRHVLGDDGAVYDDFINWIAYLIQYRRPPRSAWIVQGRQGTGKGVLFNDILTPIIGQDYCTPTSVQALETQFNGWLKTCLLALVDESKTDNMSDENEVLERMKVYIKEPHVQLRQMRQDHQKSPIFTSFIITSNSRNQAWKLEETDRRFHVAPYQDHFLDLDEQDIEAIHAELPQFVRYIMEQTVDARAATNPRNSEHKDLMKHVSRKAIDAVSRAINTGDFEFFFENVPADYHAARNSPQDVDESIRMIQYLDFIEKAVEWHRVKDTNSLKIHRDSLRCVVDYLVGNTPRSPNKFTSYMKHHDIFIKQMRIDGVKSSGIEITPQISDDFVMEWDRYKQGPSHPKKPIQSKVASITTRKKNGT